MILGPLDLAATLARLVAAGGTMLGVPAILLILSRVLSVTVGIALGRRLAQRDEHLLALGGWWALADLATLAFVLATDHVPANLAPGLGPFIWLAHASAAFLVLSAARSPRPPAPDKFGAYDSSRT